ncbi:MAG: glycosyltransferase [Planctomycetota bacterium]
MTPPSVTLVIPGRNCEATLDRCLQSVVPLLAASNHDENESDDSDAARPASGRGAGGEGVSAAELREIIFVDDGSTDSTPEIASRYPIRVLTGQGQGPGAARNLGWRAADSDWVWFIDSDCVAEPGALRNLLAHTGHPRIAGVGGSYSNLYPDSLVASLIHEEIVSRHRRMGNEVNFLATFNVLYQRGVLQQVGGFDESLKLAQDAELAYRVIAAGHRLRFEIDSRVGHHHPRNIWRYMRTQARQGYYRVMLYRQHPTKMSGDSYSGLLDFLPPPVGLLCLVLSPAMVLGAAPVSYVGLALVMALIILHMPVTLRLVRQLDPTMLNFLWFGSLRAIARGVGLACGVCFSFFGFIRGPLRSGNARVQQADLSTLPILESRD